MAHELRDVAPGLWLWRMEYPDWEPKPGLDWDGVVASTCVESGGEVAVLDPLAPPGYRNITYIKLFLLFIHLINWILL